MRLVKRVIFGTASVLLGLTLCSEAYESLAATDQPEQPVTAPSIDRIRELNELTVLEVQASEVVTTEVNGRTGGTTVVVLVHGTVTLGVDLEQARYLHVDAEQRQLTLALPQPTVRRVAIDPHASRLLSCERSGLWNMAIGPAREDEAFAASLAIGHDRMAHAASREDIVARARHHAESVLGRFVTELGWSLEMRWEE